MKLGLIFPQTEIGNDPSVIREWAQGTEALGYNQIQLFEHVLGGNPVTHSDLRGYTHRTPFHEPFVLMGYLASITKRIELATGIVILPQRQTVLVAKQAAEVDLLSGGRLRLGVAVGRNPLEFEGLGENFHNRGRRIEEQIELLRKLWTNETITFHGQWHNVTDAGINPLPIQRPIPIWMGGGANNVVLDRIGRIADGWIPGGTTAEETKSQVEAIWESAKSAGRDPKTIKLLPRVMAPRESTPDHWRSFAKGWYELGAHYIVLNTMRCGFTEPEQHLQLAKAFKDELEGIVTKS